MITRFMTIAGSLVFIGIVASCATMDPCNSNSQACKVEIATARALRGAHDRESFEVLLKLLHHEHPDVSYAAAESIAARGTQLENLEMLIGSIRGMPLERRWYAFRSLGHFHSKESLIFLAESLKGEFERMGPTPFDSRNYYYIQQSIDGIISEVERRQAAEGGD